MISYLCTWLRRISIKIFITGVTGFVGGQLSEELNNNGHEVSASIRKKYSLPNYISTFIVPTLNSTTNWNSALSNIDVVIHCAARVHVMDEKSADPLEAFREVNTRGTINLAKHAISAGVKRFVFISSIKAGGENSELGTPLIESMHYIPKDPYGLSKYEAEVELLSLAKNADMEVVIIRPTLIYGPGVKANFETMMKWLSKNTPLPLGAVENKRSLIAIDNLVDFIQICTVHPKAANEVFYISDDDDLSTTQLLKKLSFALGKNCVLIPVPSKLLSFLFSIIGMKSFSDRLLGSLQVSPNKAKYLLGWSAKVTVKEAFQETTKFYIKKNNIQ